MGNVARYTTCKPCGIARAWFDSLVTMPLGDGASRGGTTPSSSHFKFNGPPAPARIANGCPHSKSEFPTLNVLNHSKDWDIRVIGPVALASYPERGRIAVAIPIVGPPTVAVLAASKTPSYRPISIGLSRTASSASNPLRVAGNCSCTFTSPAGGSMHVSPSHPAFVRGT